MRDVITKIFPELKTKPLAPEIIGGVTTFFAMSYIVVVNPAILSTAGTGMSFSGVLTATVLLSCAMTLLMGLYARLPFAVAPGMGLNAFFTYSLILGQQIAWPTALGMVFWAGVIFLLVSATPLREKIAAAIPSSIRTGAAAGIGLFLAFIGLKNWGLVVADPVTFVKLGPMTSEVGLGLLGFFLALALYLRRSPLAFLASIALATVAGFLCGFVKWPESIYAAPDFHSVLWKFDPWSALSLSLLPAMVSIFFTDLFDSLSTFVGISEATGLTNPDGSPKNLKQGLVVDAVATLGAGMVGTSSGTAFIESAAGIESGGRTGFASVITALCFIPCFFIAPLAAMVPAFATGPVLVIIGALMFRSITKVSLTALEDAVPVFLTLLLIPMTFSITQGILWGMISHVVAYHLAGRRREITPTLYVLTAIALALTLIISH